VRYCAVRSGPSSKSGLVWLLSDPDTSVRLPLLGTSPSRIRMWENEGLLSVRRTSSGHRLYSSADIERLRELKRLVDGEGWSAAAIKVNLNAHFPDNVSPANAIGRRIRRLRTEAGWSLRDLAEQSGVAASTVSSLERDQSMPSLRSLHKLSRAFGMTLASLLEVHERDRSLVVRKNERMLLPMRTPGLAWEKLYTGDSILESLMVTVRLAPEVGRPAPYSSDRLLCPWIKQLAVNDSAPQRI